MEIALLIARLVLASVFAVAGLTKLSDRAGTRQVLIDFGVSPKLAPSVAVALPIAELVLAAGLLLTELAWAASLGVLVLLAGFSVAIAVNLAHGRRPDCRCFGRIAAAPIGWRTLARNVVLGLVALFVLSRGPNHTGYSAVAWFWERTSAEQIATLNGALALSVGGAAIWLLLQRDRRYNQLIGRMETLEVTLASRAGPIPQPPAAQVGAPSGEQPAGADAPTFELAGIDGERWTLDRLRANGKPVLLVFVDPGCGSCGALLPDLVRWQSELAGTVTLAIISRGTAESNRVMRAAHDLTIVLLQQDYEVADAYEAPSTPGAVLVRPDGTLGSPPALGENAVRALMASLKASSAAPANLGALPAVAVEPAQVHANGHTEPAHHGVYGTNDVVSMPTAAGALTVGDPAPPLHLPDLSGRLTDLVEYLGEEIVLVFWDPASESCQEIHADLRAWEEHRQVDVDSPALLVISSGSIEEIEAQGLLSTVLLDQDASGARAFHVSSVPAAVLLDDEGKIRSEVTVGGTAVLELLRPAHAYGYERRDSI